MRIDPIVGSSTQFNYSPRVNAQNKLNMGQPLTVKDANALLIKSIPCSSKEEAVTLSQQNPGRLYSWGATIYKNGKRVN